MATGRRENNLKGVVLDKALSYGRDTKKIPSKITRTILSNISVENLAVFGFYISKPQDLTSCRILPTSKT